MSRQRAIVFTHWKQDVDGSYYAALFDSLQNGESLMFASDMVMKGNPDTTHLCIIEVWTEDTRVDLLNGSVHFVAARQYWNSADGDTGKWFQDSFSAAEVSVLSAWLTAKTGFSNTQIANWFDSTPAALSNWLQNNPRLDAFKKLYVAWREWNNA